MFIGVHPWLSLLRGPPRSPRLCVKVVLLPGSLAAARPLQEALEIAPKLFYRWRKELFDHAAAAFDVRSHSGRPDGHTTRLERENERPRADLSHKDTLIAEVTEEYVRLKKHLAGTEGFLGGAGRARRGGGFRGADGDEDADQPGAPGGVAGDCTLEVPRVEEALGQGQRAQRADPAGLPGLGVGARGDHSRFHRES